MLTAVVASASIRLCCTCKRKNAMAKPRKHSNDEALVRA